MEYTKEVEVIFLCTIIDAIQIVGTTVAAVDSLIMAAEMVGITVAGIIAVGTIAEGITVDGTEGVETISGL